MPPRGWILRPVLSLIIPVLGIMALDAGLLVFLAWAYASPRFASHRISPMPPLKVSARKRVVHIIGNSTLSLLFVGAMIAALSGFAFRTDGARLWRIPVDLLAIVLIYDFAYYWMHRLMHHRKLMRYVHAVHHRARNPSALESFYLHPIELFAGLALIHLSVAGYAALAGPIHVYAYALVFLVHSTLNILVHSGLVFGHWMLAPIDALARKHSVHHKDDFGRNYASLTPFPDRIFGTSG